MSIKTTLFFVFFESIVVKGQHAEAVGYDC